MFVFCFVVGFFVVGMNKSLLFVLCAFVAICATHAQECKNMRPVILMPGVMGTVLHATADFPSSVALELPDSCPHKFDDQLIWVDFLQFIKYTCLKNYFASNYNDETKKWERIEGISFSVPKWGSTYAVDDLCPNGASSSSVVPYYHKMIEKLEKIGYVDGENLLGAGYDWKEAPTDQWVADLTKLIEDAVEKYKEKVVFIAHSMGGPYSYYFLMTKGEKWVKKNIHMYIPMAPAWMGAVKALDVMLMGLDREVPIAGKFFAPLMRHIPSVWFLLPKEEAFPGMTLATSPSKTYTFGQLADLLNDGTAGFVEGKIAAAREFFKKFEKYDQIPWVPVRSFVGYNKNTTISLKFKSDIKPHDPDGVWESVTRIMGDGDGTVPIQSARYAVDKWIKMINNGEGKGDVQIFEYEGVGHLPIIKEAKVIEKVIEVMCE